MQAVTFGRPGALMTDRGNPANSLLLVLLLAAGGGGIVMLPTGRFFKL